MRERSAAARFYLRAKAAVCSRFACSFAGVTGARFHAVGQACSAVHTETHAMGFVIYDCTAVFLCAAAGGDVEHALTDRLAAYLAVLQQSAKAAAEPGRPWAPFLQRAQGNKEALLLQREQKSSAKV